MTKNEALFAVTTLLGVVSSGSSALLFGDSLDDRLAGAGFAFLCVGLFIQHRRTLSRALDGEASAPGEPAHGAFRGLPMVVQVLGVLLVYAGIGVWVLGRV